MDEHDKSLSFGRAPDKIPLIFISHDTRDAQIAESFSKLLSSISAGVLKSFRSSDNKGSQGIPYGAEWHPELMKSLENASDIVCLLTPRSFDRPWILYEAGVAKGQFKAPVHAITLGMALDKLYMSPFAQFQNCGDDVDSLTKLVMQLAKRIPGSDPNPEDIKPYVSIFKNSVTDALGQLEHPAEEKQEKISVIASPIAMLFEEVKVMFHDFSSMQGSLIRNISAEVSEKVIKEISPFSSGYFLPEEVKEELQWILSMDMYRTEYELNMTLIEHPDSKDYVLHTQNVKYKVINCSHDNKIYDHKVGIEIFQPAPGSKITKVGARDANGKVLYDIDNEQELDSQTIIDGPFRMFQKASVIPPAIDSKASAPVFWDETVQVLPVRWQEISYFGLPTIGIKARVDSYPDSLAVDVLFGHRKYQNMLTSPREYELRKAVFLPMQSVVINWRPKAQ